MKKLVIAMDSFKESLTAVEACDTIKKAFSEVFGSSLEIINVPMADGGEGTVDALVNATSGSFVKKTVKNPLRKDIESYYGVLGSNEADGKKTAIIEMAKASGLMLLKPEERNPTITTTYGTGELILDAINKGYTNIILAIGGSATNDAGSGMLEALGVEFLDANGNKFSVAGGNLNNIASINTNNFFNNIKGVNFIVASDVDNPLIGEKGASEIFGRQKGATEEMVKLLDSNLAYFASMTNTLLKTDYTFSPGAGAAGGMGYAALTFLNATFKRGIDVVVEASNLEEKMQNANLVITGEGQMDNQTVFGKTPMGVAKYGAKANAKTIAIVGSIGTHYEEVYGIGIDAVFSILNKPVSLSDALANAKSNLYKTSKDIARLIHMVKNI